MNRRNFLSNLIKGVVTFTILPPATTYNRIWKATIDIPEKTLQLYNKLPFYLAKIEFDRREGKIYSCWNNMLKEGKFPSNRGNVIREVNILC